MKSRKFLVIIIFIIGVFSHISAFALGKRENSMKNSRSAENLVHTKPNQQKQKEIATFKSYGKIQVPASVSIGLSRPAKVNKPVTVIISVSSKVPIASGTVTLSIPSIAEIPEKKEVLWSASPSAFISETIEYTINALPKGQYRLIAILEFTPDWPNSKKLALSRSLYLDVRSDAILSSNVSFTQIKRLELRKELEERVVIDLLKEKQQPISLDVVGFKMAELNARDPNIIEDRIAELIATDPNVIHRIEQLNRIKAEIITDPNEIWSIKKVLPDPNSESSRSTIPSVGGKPTVEESVPIPGRLKNLLRKHSKDVQLDADGEPIRTISPPVSGGKPTVEKPVPIPERLKSSKKKNDSK